MAAIDDLIGRIEALPTDAGGAILLTNGELRTPATDAFFAQVIQAPQLRLVGATRHSGLGTIIVSGTTDFLSYKGIAADVTFAADAGHILCSISGTLAGDFALPLVTWIKVAKAGVFSNISQPYGIVRFGFFADLKISDANPAVLPIRIADMGNSLWQFALDEEAGAKKPPPVTIDELLGLLGGVALDRFLPQALVKVLDGLAVCDLTATLDMAAGRVDSFAVGVTVINGWPDILPGFGLDPGLEMVLALTDPTVPAARQTMGVVRGTLRIRGTAVPVFAQVAVSSQPTNWLIGLDPDPAKYASGVPGVTLPSVADLLALVSEDAAASLPAGLRDLPTIAITAFEVGFTTTPSALQSLRFAAGTTATWTVIDGFLAIEQLSLSLTVLRPGVGVSLQVGGMVGGTFAVSDAAVVYLEVFKDPTLDDWTLTGALAPKHTFNLTDIARKLLDGHVELPAQTPVIVFDTVVAQAIPGKSASLTAGSTATPWVLASGLSLDQFLLSVDYTAATGASKGVFEGKLSALISVGEVDLRIVTALDRTGDWRFAGAATVPPDRPVTVSHVAKALGWTDMPALPESLDIALLSLRFGYDQASGFAVFTAEAKSFQLTLMSGDADSSTGSRYFVAGLDLTIAADLTGLPLVGGELPRNSKLAIDNLHLVIASRALVAGDVDAANRLVAALTAPSPPQPIPSAPLRAGFNLAMDSLSLDIGSLHVTAAPGKTGGGTDAATGDASALPAAPPQGTAVSPATTSMQTNLRWFEIQRQLGPVDLERIGVEVGSGGYAFGLGAALGIGPVGFSLEGLSVSCPFHVSDKDRPSFDLSGMGLSFTQPPLEILGGLLKVPEPGDGIAFQYDGVLVIEAEQFGLAAVGSYAQYTDGEPSLFVFAELLAPLGGIPAFFVTGMMGGFGFNRSLTIPGQDQVMSFPLLALAAPPVAPAKPQDPLTVLKILEGIASPPGGGAPTKWIAPVPGQYWFAAGVLFTSFEILQSQVLAVVEFGRDLEVALLGLTTLQLPQPLDPAPPYVFVEMQIRLVVAPQDGIFAASAMLAPNSYVITPDCHLTGGFAFCMWFGSNANAGQLVATLGGYHPAFKAPSYYPQVPRLGFNWKPSASVAVHGEAYFALTPSCVMAGGALIVLYRDGDTSAWFTAHADFLIGWRPFSYTAEIAVSIGVSYRLDLLFCSVSVSASVNASVDLWGPPTGGVARVDLSVISFSVEFGSPNAALNEEPLTWESFKSLLPKDEHVCRIRITGGLHKTARADDASTEETWVVRASRLSFATRSAIPASDLTFDCDEKAVRSGIAIKPMNLTGVVSQHAVTVSGPGGKPFAGTATASTGAIPETLWGQPPSPFRQTPTKPSADLLDGAVLGYDITVPEPKLASPRGRIPFSVLGGVSVASGILPISHNAVPSTDHMAIVDPKSVASIAAIASPEVAGQRAALVAALRSIGVYAGKDSDMSLYAQQRQHLFSAPPMTCQ